MGSINPTGGKKGKRKDKTYQRKKNLEKLKKSGRHFGRKKENQSPEQGRRVRNGGIAPTGGEGRRTQRQG